MLDDGLMTRFPFDEIYGLHNMPGVPLGHFETAPGPFMSAEDNFEIVLKGLGGHAARPQATREVLVAACALVMDLQTIVARRISPTDIAVVSVTELLTDGTRNALPGTARVRGDCRSFRPEVSAEIERQMRIITEGVALSYQCTVEVTYTREFVPLVNDAEKTRHALAAAAKVFPAEAIRAAHEPVTASEDFARFLDHAPGCFVYIGNGEDSIPPHNSSFDFNDAALPHGMGFHVAIVRERLPASQQQAGAVCGEFGVAVAEPS
jgi:hippurate hydrolase